MIETHLHADFVSGHRELATRTGAEIVFGAQAGATFPHRAVREGDEISIGKVLLRIMETPGHTPESISVLVIDRDVSNQPQKVLTGDTLFVGDVGRPDLAGGKGYTPPMMAAMMYDTLHGKLLKLSDEVEVYPAHGAGSMCGRNLSPETSSTIGEQRRSNYALQAMAKDEFVRMMTADLPEPPGYFFKDTEINRAGARALTAPLLSLQQNLSNLGLDPTKPTAVICAGGYRSSAATSILQQHGFSNLLNVTGGTSAWIDAGYPVEIPASD